jgi:hypothetical protein
VKLAVVLATVGLEAAASSISVKVNALSSSGLNRPLVEITSDGEDVSEDEDEVVVVGF